MFCTIEACVSPKRLENFQYELIFCSFYLSFLKRENVYIPGSAIHRLSVLCNSSQCRKMFKIITSKWSRCTLYNTPRIRFFSVSYTVFNTNISLSREVNKNNWWQTKVLSSDVFCIISVLGIHFSPLSTAFILGIICNGKSYILGKDMGSKVI